MLDQPTNNKNNRRQHRRLRLIIVTSDLSANHYHDNIIVWPVASTRKAHSSAFVLRKHPDCQLIVWLAEIMIKLHKNTARRARWSGPCGHHSGCRLIQSDTQFNKDFL
jgi:hypothetical protein